MRRNYCSAPTTDGALGIDPRQGGIGTTPLQFLGNDTVALQRSEGNLIMATTPVTHPAAEAHLAAATHHAAAAHHHFEAAHEHNQGEHAEAKKHAAAAATHSEKAHELTTQAVKHSSK
jgi:hypothetical protein